MLSTAAGQAPDQPRLPERTEMKHNQGDADRTIDDEIAHCEREIASLKRDPEKNGINHDVMLAEWQKNRQLLIDEKKEARGFDSK
jgi:hypothetical protein